MHAGSQEAKVYFRGLDLVRGIAALAVLIYHVDFAFGLRGHLLPGGYTAVDLFFILSGFVIAMTYEKDVRQGAMTFTGMMIRRLARLYPLFFLTMLVGFVVMTARFQSNSGHLDGVPMTLAAMANIIMLPTPVLVQGSGVLFPFNAASWSVFFELMANVVFFFVLARLPTLGLLAIWVVIGVALAASIVLYGSVDVGWGWGTFVPAIPRVGFSFLTGMLLWQRYKIAPWTSPKWALCALIAMHLAYMQARDVIPQGWVAATDIVAVFGLLPLVVAAGAGVGMGRRASRISGFLGDISYSVYLTQDSLIIIAAGLTQLLFGRKIYDMAPTAGCLVVLASIVLGYISFRYFEAPLRRKLRAFSRGRTAALSS